MQAALRAFLGFGVLTTLFAGACELGMRDKSELSGGGGKVDGGTCEKGYADCDGLPMNGCETYTLKDPNNCGTCKKVCPSTGNTPTCDNGKCGTSNCPVPSLDCDTDPATCETNANTSLANCGYCGHACNLANANQTCTNGQCVLSSCTQGFADCNSNPSDGCEERLTTVTNCGTCKAACSITNGTGDCSSGTCAFLSCNSGYDDCDKVLGTGCESNLSSDPSNCGSCGTQCPAGKVCKNGACQDNTCPPPTADCDSNPDCETDITTVDNCGYCGNKCSILNAQVACTNGQCTFVQCNSGTDDCDTTAPGCETQLGTDTNCTKCGDNCTGPNLYLGYCAIAFCEMICNGGYADCSSAPGCEVNTQTDVSHCGGCPNDCNAQVPANTTAMCVQSACAYPCAAGFGNCDTTSPDCETNLTTSPSNCGACGRTCAATSCNAGLCVPEVVSGLSGARALSVTPSTVYVGRSPGGLASIDRSAWSGFNVLDSNPNVVALAYYQAILYFVETGTGVEQESASGGLIDWVANLQNGYAIRAGGDSRVYYSFTSGQGLVRSQVPCVNCGQESVDNSAPVHGVFIDDSNNLIAWTRPSQGEVHTQGMFLGNPQTVATGQASPEDVAGDYNNVYWTNNGDGTIMSAPRGGGTPTQLASGQTGAFAMAISATDVYWTTDLDPGGVYKVPKSGGAVTTMATGASHPKALVLDGNDLIWAEFGSGLVKRVPK